MRTSGALAIGFCVILAACKDDDPADSDDAFVDPSRAGESSDGSLDAQASSDGEPEAGTLDAGLRDAGLRDGGLEDGGLADGGLTDGGFADGGLADGGVGDGGPIVDPQPDSGGPIGPIPGDPGPDPDPNPSP